MDEMPGIEIDWREGWTEEGLEDDEMIEESWIEQHDESEEKKEKKYPIWESQSIGIGNWQTFKQNDIDERLRAVKEFHSDLKKHSLDRELIREVEDEIRILDNMIKIRDGVELLGKFFKRGNRCYNTTADVSRKNYIIDLYDALNAIIKKNGLRSLSYDQDDVDELLERIYLEESSFGTRLVTLPQEQIYKMDFEDIKATERQIFTSENKYNCYDVKKVAEYFLTHLFDKKVPIREVEDYFVGEGEIEGLSGPTREPVSFAILRDVIARYSKYVPEYIFQTVEQTKSGPKGTKIIVSEKGVTFDEAFISWLRFFLRVKTLETRGSFEGKTIESYEYIDLNRLLKYFKTIPSRLQNIVNTYNSAWDQIQDVSENPYNYTDDRRGQITDQFNNSLRGILESAKLFFL